jgi:hypothetical protein
MRASRAGYPSKGRVSDRRFKFRSLQDKTNMNEHVIISRTALHTSTDAREQCALVRQTHWNNGLKVP